VLTRRVGCHVAAICTIAVGAAILISPAPALSVGAASPVALSTPNLAAHPPTKKALLNPAHKYFGVFVQGAPSSLNLLNNASNPESVRAETGKTPNLDMWFQAWDGNATSGKSNFQTNAAKNACSAGILPMMTWESWNTSVTAPNEGPAYAQKAFAAKTIASGKYDKYIRATALAIKSTHCPVAIRFDQEANGFWYPWGLRTTGMDSLQDTPKEYIAMWRHVWNVFHKAGATNVLWVWSPNILNGPTKGQAKLKASYPGNKYVDEVGIDGYFYPGVAKTFATRFNPTIAQLKGFAKSKRWMIAETAVGTSSIKPKQITDLLDSVGTNKQFNGLVYFDEYKSSAHSDWLLNETSASQHAFKVAIDKKVYASAKPGTL
jgi:mannan endo-1,4-beta-mannosidase